MPGTGTLSTADARRPLVAAAAFDTFSARGYFATTVADVARAAKISPAYVFKLFPGKESLFVAALDTCFDDIVRALTAGADAADTHSPSGVLSAMADAYARLITDRRHLMLQVHAQSVADNAEIGSALRRGLERVTMLAKSRSRATDREVQRFMAYGQLCHLIATAQLDGISAPWASLLTAGIEHLA